ncbi:sporulation membrane protein YtaF [Paenibacillus sp. J2TS4]|uniref:sporulation membrane protein YtaF n=1 Tax=Paenibacillus sp. J2TS4 TaxID=2807194 RepID=UPI001B0D5C27|nr:sporulation membrane protein YtaF [Paenibacillus sp. J2TS4]GIP31574.1 sporulation membrane protein YtaF [Paenibacillus sp. J2TS4]
MTSWLIIAALTFSSSIDNLGVGLSYGIRNIRISLLSNLLIAVICFLFSVCGIYFGLWISQILPGILPVVLGSFILVIIGIRIMLLAVPRKDQASKNKAEAEGRAASAPSQSIGFIESIVLGVALSANALTNGVGAGLLGFSPLLISILAAVGSFVTVWAGVAFGVRLTHVRIGRFTIGQFGTLISGFLLLLVAFTAFVD